MENADSLGQQAVKPAISLQAREEASHHFGSDGLLAVARDLLFHRFLKHGLKAPSC